MIKVAVRVCESSKLRLKHTESYRAITDKEFIRYMEYNTDINLGIIEVSALASDKDIENIVKVLEYCEETLGKRVFILSYKNDIGLDDVAYSVRELQDLIESETGEAVSTYKKNDNLFEDTVKTKKDIIYSSNPIDENVEEQIESINDEDELIEVVKLDRTDDNTYSSESNEALNKEIESLKALLKSTMAQYTEKDNLYQNIVSLKAEADNIVIRLNKEIEYYKDKILAFESKNYELELKNLNDELLSYKAKLDSLDALEVRIKELDSLCDKKDKELDALKEQISSNSLNNSLKYKRIKLLKYIINIFNAYIELSSSINLKDSSIADLESELSELKNRLSETTSNLELVNKREDNLLKDLESLKVSSNETLEGYKLELESLNQKYSLVSSELDTCKSTLSNSESAIAQNEVLKTKISLLEQELKSSLTSLSEKEKEISKLSSLKREVVTVNSSKTFSSINYTGKAKIVTVYGISSCGITNMAYSIANKLKGNILFLDLDISNPKSDKYTHKNPMVDIDSVRNSLYRTGVGVLFSLGVDSVINNFDRLAIKIHKTRDNELTWLSGIYSDLKLETIDDFESFINYIGSYYDYIVVDVGKLGYSNLNDSMIKSLSDIAFINFVITTNDTSSIRGTSLKIKKIGLSNASNIRYFINLSKNSILSDISKKSIGNSKYYFFPIINSVFGTDKLLIEESTLDSRLSDCLIENKLEVI